jgi:hypothetical protein
MMAREASIGPLYLAVAIIPFLLGFSVSDIKPAVIDGRYDEYVPLLRAFEEKSWAADVEQLIA